MRFAVVVPSVRPEHLRRFLDAWWDHFVEHEIALYVVWDLPRHPKARINANFPVYEWDRHEIAEALGARVSCIPGGDAACKDFGVYLAAKEDGIYDAVLTLDDDCLPWPENGVPAFHLIESHEANLTSRPNQRWMSSVDYRVRGIPYDLGPRAPVKLSHGLWTNVPDLDAMQRIPEGVVPAMAWDEGYNEGATFVPRGVYMPICGMNVAYTVDVAPLMWQPVLPHGMRRWADIWSGVIFKKIADSQGWAIANGRAVVKHDRASSVEGSLREEYLGYGVHELLWRVVDEQEIDPRWDPKQAWLKLWTAVGNRIRILQETAEQAHVWMELWDA